MADVARALPYSLRSDLGRVGGETLSVGDSRENYQMKDLGPVLSHEIPGTVVNVAADVVDKRSYNVVFDKIERLLASHASRGVTEGCGAGHPIVSGAHRIRRTAGSSASGRPRADDAPPAAAPAPPQGAPPSTRELNRWRGG